MEKKFYIDFLFTEKAFFTENEKNIYLIWEIFFYPENIYSFCKKIFFDHKKYICDLLREKGPTAVKRRFKTQLTAFSLYMLCNIFTSTS